MTTPQMTLEDLVAKIPEVQRVIADDLQRKRDAVTGHRNRLIDQATEIEASIPALEAVIKKQTDATEKARAAFEKARSELWESEQKLADMRGQWSSVHRMLRKDFGNLAVDSAASRVNGWIQHLCNREVILQGKAAERHQMGPFWHLKFPEAAAELEKIRQQITDSRRAASEIEHLMTSKGHPDEITAAAEAIVTRVVLNDTN